MTTRYTTIKTELVDPELETKIDVETQLEPVTAEVPNNLYEAIVNQPIEPSSNIDITVQASPFSYSVPNRVYTLIVPDKPPILAEERIFVYVPKVTIETAGIAKFSPEHFNIVQGEVSLKESYLSEWLATNLLKPRLILVVTELPLEGLENKLYLVPINATTSNGYVWNVLIKDWVALGTMELAISNYYTKTEINTLLNSVKVDLSKYYTKTEINTLLNNVEVDLSKYYTIDEVNTLLNSVAALQVVPDGETIVYNTDDKLEAANVSIWRYK